MWACVQAFFANPALASLTSIFIGAVVTWLAARYYYKKAGDDLKAEAALLRKANMAVVYMLEHPDADIEVRRDGAGNPIGVIISGTARAKGSVAAHGVGSDARADS